MSYTKTVCPFEYGVNDTNQYRVSSNKDLDKGTIRQIFGAYVELQICLDNEETRRKKANLYGTSEERTYLTSHTNRFEKAKQEYDAIKNIYDLQIELNI